MILNRKAANDRKNMTAEDLFEADITQVFDKKTGNYLGFIRNGQEQLMDEPEDPQQEKEDGNSDPAQLSIFD